MPPGPPGGNNHIPTPVGSNNQLEGAIVATTQDEIIAGIAEIIEEVTGIEPSEVTPEKSFVDDLDIDSLSMVEIAVQAEDKFGVKIPDDELANLKTVGDAVNYVSANSK
jgi:acyl carrier protein